MMISDKAEVTHTPTLLVIGAGPKGLALAAKCAVLRQLGYAVPHLILIDKNGVAPQWNGNHGYTDGQRLLGTLPDKDVGFPYDSTCWGDAAQNQQVDQAMRAYSWQAYLIETYKYAEWIDRGRPRPTHRQWSAYLEWVAQRCEAEVLRATVTSITRTPDDRRWQVHCRTATDEQDLLGDGLVLTGPGAPVAVPGQPTDDPRVLNGSSVWLALDGFMHLHEPRTAPLRFGVVGTGETAAATVVALMEIFRDGALIEVLSPRGVLYSRDEGFEENQMFSNPDPHRSTEIGKHIVTEGTDELRHTHAVRWLSLTEADRREFVRRTDRGVFSVQAMQDLTQYWNVRSITGNAMQIHRVDDEVVIDLAYGERAEQRCYDYVVVARGFDATWFLRLMDDAAREQVNAACGGTTAEAIEHAIDTNLAVAGMTPLLHLPMLAALAQGPGFPNLSCLGLLADRILSAYIAPPGSAPEE